MTADTRELVAVGPGRPDERPASVRIRAEVRPEAATLVTVGTFDGPLALLLTLIEQRELDVRTVPLGELAAAYLEALGSLSGDRLPHLSAFTAVAAQLILIKSRAILPDPPAQPESAPEEAGDPAEELRQRLILYRTYRDAAKQLADRLDGGRLFHREPAAREAEAAAAAFPTGALFDPRALTDALERSVRLTPPREPPPEVVPRTVTLAERAAMIRDALRNAPSIVLQELLRDVTDRVVMAVTFLAVLELAKRRELTVEQSEPWGPIRCRRLQPGGAS